VKVVVLGRWREKQVLHFAQGDKPFKGSFVTEVFLWAQSWIAGNVKRLTIPTMERKIFWFSFTVLGLLADFVLPIWWALGATIPIGYASWWIAYRSGWFD